MTVLIWVQTVCIDYQLTAKVFMLSSAWSADYFSKLTFIKKNLSGTLSECQTVVPDLGPNCLHRLSADDKSFYVDTW